MTIKLNVLQSGENVIADVKEIISEENVVGYLLDNPHVVQYEKIATLLEEKTEDSLEQIQISLLPWIVLSEDKKILIRPESIVTVVEPVALLKEMYEEKVNGKFETDCPTE